MIAPDKTKQATATQTGGRGGIWRWAVRLAATVCAITLLAASFVLADWWVCLPDDQQATYVGGDSCIECHQAEHELWTGSHHDLAMDRATDETVLADFDNATLEHFGITSRMFRDGRRFMVHTEGPDGRMTDFEVKYVFGVDPLQQFMVEFDRPAGMPEHEVARLQVLRLSWDVHNRRWFYLMPPDVSEKLDPSDPLHWTRRGQNWNHMCADCHSTDLRKNFDLKTNTYHTTFSDIDVHCEACHGPGSVHVELAEANSLFWDRKLGYGLPRLKGDDPSVEIEMCAKCHSRRRIVHPDFHAGRPYYDHYANETLGPNTYYADGQILDEVYVFGSFIQSKMYHKGIRCSDCHDVHSARVKFTNNRLCTSCHAHPSGKLDAPAHHHHKVDSTGALCVECHMPESPYMAIDPRRDHSIRIPRPDLSVELGTPNACTKCHLDPERVDPQKRDKLVYYADWLNAARAGDEQVQAEIDRVDRWMDEVCREWYGDPPPSQEHFAHTLAAAWEGEPEVLPRLIDLTQRRRLPAIVRASALAQLPQFDSPAVVEVSIRALNDPDPQVRTAAITNLDGAARQIIYQNVTPMLDDPVRAVRVEAARVLATMPPDAFTDDEERRLDAALAELRAGLHDNADQAGAHMLLALLHERRGRWQQAMDDYRNAIRVQPDVTGPRSNLASLCDRLAEQAARARRFEAAAQYQQQAQQHRDAEFPLLERDATLAADNSLAQYRYGLALYLRGREADAEQVLLKAHRLEPNAVDAALALTLLYQKLERWDDALKFGNRLLQLRPDRPDFQQLLEQLRQQAHAKP